MTTKRRSVLGLLAAGGVAVFLPGRKPARAQEPGPGAAPSLVNAWLASASRPTGQGIVLLTLTSGGTFFRSGDTHPALGVGHRVWNPSGQGAFDGPTQRCDSTRTARTSGASRRASGSPRAGQRPIHRPRQGEHLWSGRQRAGHESDATAGEAAERRTVRRLTVARTARLARRGVNACSTPPAGHRIDRYPVALCMLAKGYADAGPGSMPDISRRTD